MDGCSYKWMKAEYDISLSDSHIIFRSLFTVIVLVQLFVSLIHAAPAQRLIGRDSNKEIRHSFRKSLTHEVEEIIHLQNYKHRGYLQILGGGGGININAPKSSAYARIRMIRYKSKDELDKDHYVQLQGNSSKAYMCFNRKGKLVAKYGISRRWRCVFILHKTSDDLYEFQSAANPDWVVNFSKKGKPSRYTAKRNRQRKKSARFTLTIADTKPHQSGKGIFLNPPNFNYIHNKMAKEKRLSIRAGNGHRVRHSSGKILRSIRQSRAVISSTDVTSTLNKKPSFENT